MRLIAIMVALAAGAEFAAAQSVPLPLRRPAVGQTAPPAAASAPEEPAPPSACRLRLTPELAVAPSLPVLAGPNECGADDVVRLEAIWLADKTRVAVSPPATLRCEFAEAIVHWVREDVAAAARTLGSPLRGIENFASYDCRGRNRIVGAKLSEHGKANALDVRSLKLVDGSVVELTDGGVARDFREAMRASACRRFATVLGPGSDGYHENHVHLDLAQRRGGYRMCQWELRDPAGAVPGDAGPVPLPRSRPAGRPG